MPVTSLENYKKKVSEGKTLPMDYGWTLSGKLRSGPIRL